MPIWDWIKGQVNRLWATVSAHYRSLRAQISGAVSRAIGSAISWFNANIKPSLDRAAQQAKYAVTIAKSFFTSIPSIVRNWVDSKFGKLLQQIKYWSTIIGNLGNEIKAWIMSPSNPVMAPLLQRLKYIETFARDPWKFIKTIAIPWFLDQIAPLAQQIKFLLTALSDPFRFWTEGWLKNLPPILEWLIGAWGFLQEFVEHPIRFILMVLSDYFLPLLEWTLAYAIGTIYVDLPPRPDWMTEGFGGAIIIGKGPPPYASGLASPLDSLRISGYPFRPGHPGIDLGLQMGDPVYAMHDGEVTFSAWDVAEYGYAIRIQGGGWHSLYGHLSSLAAIPGQRVRQRDPIGRGGSSGNSTGPHLHLELKFEGKFIDPVTVLPIGGV